MFEEQVGWAAEAGVDFIIGETFSWARRGARSRSRSSRRRNCRPSSRSRSTRGGHARGLSRGGCLQAARGCRRRRRRAQLHPRPRDDAAAAREDRPRVTMPRRGAARFRTARPRSEPTFQSLRDPRLRPHPRRAAVPDRARSFTCNRFEIAEFAREAHALGVALPRRLLRRGPAPHPRCRRGARPHAAREPRSRRTCRSTPSSARTQLSFRKSRLLEGAVSISLTIFSRPGLSLLREATTAPLS